MDKLNSLTSEDRKILCGLVRGIVRDRLSAMDKEIDIEKLLNQEVTLSDDRLDDMAVTYDWESVAEIPEEELLDVVRSALEEGGNYFYYRLTDGQPDCDAFLIVHRHKDKSLDFDSAWSEALAKAKLTNPDDWDRDQVIDILIEQGWEIESPNYDVIHD